MKTELTLRLRQKRLEDMTKIRDAFDRVQLNDRDAELSKSLDRWVEKETQFLIGESVQA